MSLLPFYIFSLCFIKSIELNNIHNTNNNNLFESDFCRYGYIISHCCQTTGDTQILKTFKQLEIYTKSCVINSIIGHSLRFPNNGTLIENNCTMALNLYLPGHIDINGYISSTINNGTIIDPQIIDFILMRSF
ncbi:unnamed protein product, partial [Didymodactylos carnosus]